MKDLMNFAPGNTSICVFVSINLLYDLEFWEIVDLVCCS